MPGHGVKTLVLCKTENTSLLITAGSVMICLYSGSFWKPESGCKLPYAKYVYGVLQSSPFFNERWVNLSSRSIREKPQLPAGICTGLCTLTDLCACTRR